MRYLLMLIIFVAANIAVTAQTTAGANNSGQKRTTKKITARQQRGTGQYHGSRDTTPGSPVGTGGAGGDMSGSPAGSAIETDDQTNKAEVEKDTITNSQSTAVKKVTNSKRKTTRRKTKSNL